MKHETCHVEGSFPFRAARASAAPTAKSAAERKNVPIDAPPIVSDTQCLFPSTRPHAVTEVARNQRNARTLASAPTSRTAVVRSVFSAATVPGSVPRASRDDVFDAVLSSAPRLRAAGCLHDTFESLQLVVEHGGRAGMLNFFNAVLAGRVHSDILSIISDLRAVLFYKDAEHTAIRPIGIGEALRRRAQLVAHQAHVVVS